MDILLMALNSMIVSAYSSRNSLAGLAKIARLKPKSTRKADVVEALYAFYSDPDSAEAIFKTLGTYELKLLTHIVQSGYSPIISDVKAIAKAHNFKAEKAYSYYSERVQEYFPKDSPLHVFFAFNFMPPTFKNFLDKTIPPYVRVFEGCTVRNSDQYKKIEGREHRYRDFDMLLSFINSNKSPATKAVSYMSKTALLKFHKTVGYDEVCNSASPTIEGVKNAGEAIVSFGMIQLLRCADVIDIVKEQFVPSENAVKFASMSMPEKAEFLFNAYIKHGNSIIDECNRIAAVKLKFTKKNYDLSGPRREVVSYLAECPVGEWIDFNSFSRELLRSNQDMFGVVGQVLERDDYYNQYYSNAAWNDFEHHAISIMLMEYMAVLGAVDVCAEDSMHGDYGTHRSVDVRYFRLTDLGAYLFGVTDSYTEKPGSAFSDIEKGFIVLPNFDIVIPNSKDRMRHELFFDRFAEKTTADEEVSVYKLDFKGMVQALNIGLYIREISSYCSAFSSEEVPENVIAAFDDWEAQSSRIRIRTITVIEADHKYLLEEIKNYRGMDALSEGRVMPVLVLEPNAAKKAKILIEKNQRFCMNMV